MVYTNEEGFKEIRRVPDNASYLDYPYGALVGPPDLSELGLTAKKAKELNHALVDANLVSLRLLGGKRIELIRIIERVLGTTKVSDYRDMIIRLYQQEAFPEAFQDEEK